MEYRYRIQTEERTYRDGNTVPAKYTPYDFYNTALKIGKKRAMVDAVLTVTGASEIFTQDAEDLPPEMLKETPARPSQPARKPLPTAPKPKAKPPNGHNGTDPVVAPEGWTPGKREEISGKVDRAWPNDYQEKRYFFAKVNGMQLQTMDVEHGGRLLEMVGQPLKALVEQSPKPGKVYLIAFAKEEAKQREEPKRSSWEDLQRCMAEADLDEKAVLAAAKRLQLVPDRTPKLSGLAKPVYTDLLESWPDVVEAVRQPEAATKEDK
jgi:hypothetical protein